MRKIIFHFSLLITFVSFLVAGCKSAEEKELERLQTEQLKMEIQAKIDQANLAQQRAEQERLEILAAKKAEEERQRREDAEKFVQARAEYRLAEIIRPLLGSDPSISVISHDCTLAGSSFTATVKVYYRGGISGDSLSVGGKLVRKSDGNEYFQYDQVSPEILGRLAMVGMDEKTLKLMARGEAYLEF